MVFIDFSFGRMMTVVQLIFISDSTKNVAKGGSLDRDVEGSNQDLNLASFDFGSNSRSLSFSVS